MLLLYITHKPNFIMIPRYQEQRKTNKVTTSQVNTVVIPDWFTGFGVQSVVPRIE